MVLNYDKDEKIEAVSVATKSQIASWGTKEGLSDDQEWSFKTDDA